MNTFKKRLKELIESEFQTAEGKTTGGDFEATFERLGRSKRDHDKNPDAKPGEPGHRRIKDKEAAQERRKRIARKVMRRGWKQEVAKNKETRKRRDADAGGLEMRRNPETGEGDLYATNAPKLGGASDWEDMVRQEREKQDFATSQGDTSYLSKEGLKKNIIQRSKLALKRGKKSNQNEEIGLVDYISKSPEKVMSGGTRAFKRELRAIQRRAKKSGGKEVGTDREGRTLDVVPTTRKGYRRRARLARLRNRRALKQ